MLKGLLNERGVFSMLISRDPLRIWRLRRPRLVHSALASLNKDGAAGIIMCITKIEEVNLIRADL